VTPLFELGLALDRVERRFITILAGQEPAPPRAASEPAPATKVRQR
jgi:hypothetical protein